MPSGHQGALDFYAPCLPELPKQGSWIRVSGMNTGAMYQGIRPLLDVSACSSYRPSLLYSGLGTASETSLPLDTQPVPFLKLRGKQTTWGFCAGSEV